MNPIPPIPTGINHEPHDLVPSIPNAIVPFTDAAFPKYKINPEPYDDIKYSTIWGTPVYSPLLLYGPKPTTGIFAGQLQYGPNPLILRVDTCVMTITQTKQVIKTAAQGRSGTIKEYIALGDFDISVEGIITTPYANVYPTEDVHALLGWLMIADVVQMTSEFLNRFTTSLYDVVVESFEIPQLEGTRNQQPFRFRAVSDAISDNIILPAIQR